MARAVNRIQELGGGSVVCCNSEIIAEMAFPIGGIISDKPMEDLAAEMTQVQKAAEAMGCVSPDIRATLSVLATPAIPYIRICEAGLFNVRLNKGVDLIAE
jgi:adenine deaminase